MDNNKAPHILNTSANLLGFTFLVLVSLKALGLSQKGIADEISSICVVLFSFACLTSFISIKTDNEKRSKRFENIADFVFFVGIMLCTALSALFFFDLVKI